MIINMMLLEGVEEIQKYFPKIELEKIKELIALDPTYQGGERLGNFGKWILTLYNNGRLLEEDFYKVTEYLTLFKNFRKKMPVQDLGKIKSLPDLGEMVLPFANQEVEKSKNEQKREIKGDVEKVYEDDNWLVIIPKTHEASCLYGAHTQWCTTSKDNPGTFEHYNNQGPLFIIMDKTHNKKYQFHFESGQFMDEGDNRIDNPEKLLPEHITEKLWDIVTFTSDGKLQKNWEQLFRLYINGWAKFIKDENLINTFDKMMFNDLEKHLVSKNYNMLITSLYVLTSNGNKYGPQIKDFINKNEKVFRYLIESFGRFNILELYKCFSGIGEYKEMFQNIFINCVSESSKMLLVNNWEYLIKIIEIDLPIQNHIKYLIREQDMFNDILDEGIKTDGFKLQFLYDYYKEETMLYLIDEQNLNPIISGLFTYRYGDEDIDSRRKKFEFYKDIPNMEKKIKKGLMLNKEITHVNAYCLVEFFGLEDILELGIEFKERGNDIISNIMYSIDDVTNTYPNIIPLIFNQERFFECYVSNIFHQDIIKKTSDGKYIWEISFNDIEMGSDIYDNMIRCFRDDVAWDFNLDKIGLINKIKEIMWKCNLTEMSKINKLLESNGIDKKFEVFVNNLEKNASPENNRLLYLFEEFFGVQCSSLASVIIHKNMKKYFHSDDIEIDGFSIDVKYSYEEIKTLFPKPNVKKPTIAYNLYIEQGDFEIDENELWEEIFSPPYFIEFLESVSE